MMKRIFYCLIILLCSCAVNKKKYEVPILRNEDKYSWLLDSNSSAVSNWREQENYKTINSLKSYKSFIEHKKTIKRIVGKWKTIPEFYMQSKYFLYKTYKDKKHPKGNLQRINTQSYLAGKQQWDIVIDIDQLEKELKTDLVLTNMICMPPNDTNCMVSFSIGGTDRHITYEYDTLKQIIIKTGFKIPLAQSQVQWINKDELLVATDWNRPELMTGSYPKQVRLLKRGQKLADAKVIYTNYQKSSGVFLDNAYDFSGVAIIADYIGFRDVNYYLYYEDLLHSKLPLPTKGVIIGAINENVIFWLKEKWNSHSAGTIITFDYKKYYSNHSSEKLINEIFVPKKNEYVDEVLISKNKVYINLLKNVKSSLISLNPLKKFKQKEVDLPKNGAIYVYSSDSKSHNLIISYVNFDTPETFYSLNDKKNSLKKIISSPVSLKSLDIVHRQHWAKSRDGVKVPYFIMFKKGIKFNGLNPTIMYGYGASRIINKPFYSDLYNSTWINKGGIFVVANVRGGGEFGTKWNESGKLLNKKNSFYDFNAIAEDLIKRKYTNPRHLGAVGTSWGGLLVLVASQMRPELYNAVLAKAPMVDMINFPELGQPGWTGVFGDPHSLDYQKYLLSYSPYHNIKKNSKYPHTFLISATNDERIHPAHSRRFVEKFKLQHGNIYYLEFLTGGHGLYNSDEDYINLRSYQMTFFWEYLK